MSDFHIGDRVAYRGRAWFIETISRFGWGGGFCLLTLVDPDSRTRERAVLASDCEPLGLRVVAVGRFPRLVWSDGVHVG